MATGTVVYTTSNRLECGCRKNSPVILCVSPSLVPPHHCSIDATLLSESVGADCGTQLFTYLFKYDTEDLLDPATPLDSKSIFGVVCRSCLTKWVECQLPCFTDSETVTWSTDEEGCFVATASGGGGGDFWSLIGNAGTVDGTNFLGTTDNIPFTIRVHNEPALRIDAGSDGVSVNITGNPHNSNSITNSRSSFIGNGNDPVQFGQGNVIAGGVCDAIVCGGGNTITANDTLDYIASFIGGGDFNTITSCFASSIVEGEENSITLQRYAFIGSGNRHVIDGTTTGLTPAFDPLPGGNAIVGGSESQIICTVNDALAVVNPTDNVIVASFGSVIDSDQSSFIGGGGGHSITVSNYLYLAPISHKHVYSGGTNTGNNAIVGGNSNVIDQTYHSIIGGGGSNEISGITVCGIFSGEHNIIHSSTMLPAGQAPPYPAAAASAILGGQNNSIDTAISSVIDGGDTNSIGGTSSNINYLSLQSIIGCGTLNVITNGVACGIFSGEENEISGDAANDNYPSDHCVIAGGFDNIITKSSTDCSILGGSQNAITLEIYSSIVGGQQNEINTAGSYNFIGGGAVNVISATDLSDEHFNNSIVGGNGNTIDNSDYSVLGGGHSNSIVNSRSSFIGSGNDTADFAQGNIITGGVCDAIVCGGGNTITGDDSNFLVASFIGAGDFNTITSSLASAVVAGENNSVVSSDVVNLPTTSRCFVGAGRLNVITNEEDGCIVAGQSNAITGTSFSVSNFIGAGRGNVISDGLDSGIVTGALNTVGHTNFGTILGGQKNSIPTGSHYASVLGGALLKLGVHSFGYQNPLSLNVNTDPYRDVSAFSGIGFCGDADFWVGNTDGIARKLKLFEPNSAVDYSTANYSSFESQAQSAKIEYVMPAAAGTPGQQLTIDTVVGTVVTLKWA